jgi:hydroxyethylthiazole kinase
MLTSVLGAYCAANPDELTLACVAAVCGMGLCGEYAFEKVSAEEAGTGSFRTYLIDYMSKLDGEQLESGAKLQKA